MLEDIIKLTTYLDLPQHLNRHYLGNFGGGACHVTKDGRIVYFPDSSPKSSCYGKDICSTVLCSLKDDLISLAKEKYFNDMFYRDVLGATLAK